MTDSELCTVCECKYTLCVREATESTKQNNASFERWMRSIRISLNRCWYSSSISWFEEMNAARTHYLNIAKCEWKKHFCDQKDAKKNRKLIVRYIMRAQWVRCKCEHVKTTVTVYVNIAEQKCRLDCLLIHTFATFTCRRWR